MQKKLSFFTKLGFLLTALAGTFLHFLYGLTGKTLWTGLFSSINESVWEHMKLVFFPLTAYFIFECLRLGSKVPALVSASPWGILSGTFSVPVVFYTYTGILGRHITAVDIGIFLLGIFLGFYTQRTLIRRDTCPRTDNIFLPWSLVVLTGLCFFIFTFRPPSLPLFHRP